MMASFVDTSLFALNITTGLSLGLAVDYSLLMVSRYREELERLGPTREAHAITVRTAGTGGALLRRDRRRRARAPDPDAAALPLLARLRRRDGRDPLGGPRPPGRPVDPAAHRPADQLARGPPRARGLRPLAGLVPPRPRGDGPPGPDPARLLRAPPRLLGAPPPHDPDRPERPGRAAGQGVLRGERLRRGELRARGHRGGDRRGRGRSGPGSWPRSRRRSSRSRG